MRRSSAFIHTPSANYNTPNSRRQSMEVSRNVGRGVKDSEGRVDTRPQRTNRRGSRDKAQRENGKLHAKPKPPREGNKVNREGVRPSPNKGVSGKPKSRHGKNTQAKAKSRKKANKKPKPKMRIIPSPVESDEPASAEVLKRKKYEVFPNSRDPGVVSMVEEKKKEKHVGKAKKNSKKKVTKHEVELTHVHKAENSLVQKQRKHQTKNPPSKVGLVHEKRKDSEPSKAQVESRTENHANSFSSLAPDSTQVPAQKISFARSSSSSDHMRKDNTPASKTCSPEPIRDISREREQVEGRMQSAVVQGSELAPGDLKLYE